MRVRELPVRAFLSHLRRHPLPEIMDEACMEALQSVEAQYGDTISHGAGLEVRLGMPDRYVDYILNIDTSDIPGVPSLWHEIDYEEFRRAHREGDGIVPCLFANVSPDGENCARWLEDTLAVFLGESRTLRLRDALDRMMARLPEGAYIKQIGTMSSRMELDIMRLVILFPSWEDVFPGLSAIGWQGDVDALRAALAPWREVDRIAVNLDLSAAGVLPKIGIEVAGRWRHPLLVDRFIARLEEAGLCLSAKADALRRWIRIRPDGDPFIQTQINYFKLNYRDGRVVEAKAYLEQSPYLHHHYFDAYELPTRLDVELVGKTGALALKTALAVLDVFRQSRGRCARFYGATGYGQLDALLRQCRARGIDPEIVVPLADFDSVRAMTGSEGVCLLVDLNTDAGGRQERQRAAFSRLAAAGAQARWFMDRKNASRLQSVILEAEAAGLRELIITYVRPGSDGPGSGVPDRKQIDQAAETIQSWRRGKHGLSLTVDSCFSPLRAFHGGEDAGRNPNRGIERGCEAGCSFLAVRADGALTPCLFLDAPGEPADLVDYWTESPRLQAIRDRNRGSEMCGGCPYLSRCLPCPTWRPAPACSEKTR